MCRHMPRAEYFRWFLRKDRLVYKSKSLMIADGSLGPRPSPLRDLVRAFNCAGEGNIENGARAWDETSRAHRRAGSRAPRCLDRKYVYTRERSTAKLLADSYM